ncbi:uncharacterized protein GGS22DRAFT_193671 [Annulohypoxylon maeteangense]|uniref:uncharacterized protein n=1 Tax=Annulohypoxylon maeteangense TaxID=1927788 RepID=UPI00200813C5|nr:uncharacterized protein GGS22DRAFT_193671 [Annulohypoxylon maeteangense]KAI0880081.1 hypothetical protein GGS22DRAFT_193671 [Annulohypoxylon maeteangense]
MASAVPGTPGIRGPGNKAGGKAGEKPATTESNVRPAIYPREGDVRDYPKGVFELLWTGIFGDSDKKWGPFYKHIRAAKKEGRWEEWDTSDIVAAEPNDRSDIIDPDEDTRRDLKTQKSDAYIMTRELRDDVRPAHLNVEELLGRQIHPGDYDDKFFRRQWNALYENVVEFSNKWFDARVDLRYLTESQQGPNQIWGSHLTEQFTEYSRLVVQEDSKVGGWPAILNESQQRKWLVVGIMAQIIEKKIFTELLFGAERVIQDELERLDLLWIQKEGYGRKTARAITARYGMEGRLLPRNFWTQVDDLAAKTMKVFLPLLNAMKEVVPNSLANDYCQECFLQEIHAIIAHAGVIQVCTAVSPSIFHVLSATPGARMDYDIERQSDMQIYRDSKAFYEEQDRHWTEYVTESMAGRPAQNRTGTPIKLPQNEEERRTMEYHRIRGARVKFAVFPKLTRYHPINKGKGEAELERPFEDEVSWDGYKETSEGQDVVNLSDCWVIYKQGLIYPEEGFVDAQTLDSHLQSLIKPPTGLVGWLWMVIMSSWSTFRKAFWHILFVAALSLLVSSFFVGASYFRWLAANKLPYIFFSLFCGVQIVQILLRKGKTFPAWVIISIPIALTYGTGFIYYTLSRSGDAADADAHEYVDNVLNNAGA